jgi:sulfur-oxidizing protein SoxY
MAVDMSADRVPQFVRSLNVTYNGKAVMSAKVDFSLSDNPVFRFYFVPREPGELRVEAEDTHDRVYTQSLRVSEGLVASGT